MEWDVECGAWGGGSRMGDHLGQATNCLMFAFPFLLWVRKGLIHFCRAHQLFPPLWEESMAGLKIKRLINRVGLGSGESGSTKAWPTVRAGLAAVLGLAQGALGWLVGRFLPRCITEL